MTSIIEANYIVATAGWPGRAPSAVA